MSDFPKLSEARTTQLIAEWHEGGGIGVPLWRWLGVTEDEYKRWVETGHW
jgi:hypothetical protein